MTEKLDRIESQQATNTEAIAQLNNAMNEMLAQFIQPLVQQSQVNQKALNGLIEMTATAEVERGEQNTRIENLLNDAKADREENRKSFDAVIAQADRDREENRRRFDAQQQISQAMLLELARVNSRLELLERAS